MVCFFSFFPVNNSVNINQGLLALGNVISALGNDRKNKHMQKHNQRLHVPYR